MGTQGNDFVFALGALVTAGLLGPLVGLVLSAAAAFALVPIALWDFLSRYRDTVEVLAALVLRRPQAFLLAHLLLRNKLQQWPDRPRGPWVVRALFVLLAPVRWVAVGVLVGLTTFLVYGSMTFALSTTSPLSWSLPAFHTLYVGIDTAGIARPTLAYWILSTGRLLAAVWPADALRWWAAHVQPAIWLFHTNIPMAQDPLAIIVNGSLAIVVATVMTVVVAWLMTLSIVGALAAVFLMPERALRALIASLVARERARRIAERVAQREAPGLAADAPRAASGARRSVVRDSVVRDVWDAHWAARWAWVRRHWPGTRRTALPAPLES
jgi:hypothetical protein